MLSSPKLTTSKTTLKNGLGEVANYQTAGTVAAIATKAIAEVQRTLQAINEFLQTPYDNLPSVKLTKWGTSNYFGSAASLPARSNSIKRHLSPSQYIPVYGYDGFLQIAYHAYHVLAEQRLRQEPLSILDIRAYLSEEIKTAYEWLEEPTNLCLWTTFCNRELANAIKRREYRTINKWHRSFEENARVSTAHSVTGALAWAIIVDAALLNERLNADVRRIAEAKECCNLQAGCYKFYLPDTVKCPTENLSPELQPSCQQFQGELLEASAVFQEYVRCRWPIHVFALDPRENRS